MGKCDKTGGHFDLPFRLGLLSNIKMFNGLRSGFRRLDKSHGHAQAKSVVVSGKVIQVLFQ